MLERLITSTARVRLLELFLLNPDRKMYIREIARFTGLNLNAVRRELTNLEEFGLLASSTSGNTKTYAVNKENPILQELTMIVLKTEGVGKVLKENIESLGQIRCAFLYGSFAKNAARIDSDVDLFLIGKVDEDALEPLIRRSEERLQRDVNYVIFTVEEFKRRREQNDPFVSNVLAEPRIILIGEIP